MMDEARRKEAVKRARYLFSVAQAEGWSRQDEVVRLVEDVQAYDSALSAAEAHVGRLLKENADLKEKADL